MELTREVKVQKLYNGRNIHIPTLFNVCLNHPVKGETARIVMDTNKPNTLTIEFINDKGEWGDNNVKG